MSENNSSLAAQAKVSKASPAVQHLGLTSTIAASLPSLGLTHLSPDLKFLIDYYDTTLCPGLNVDDGSPYPYRHEIIRMVLLNPALLEAICAVTYTLGRELVSLEH